MAEPQYVWVVQSYLGSRYPTVETYELIKVKASGFHTVKKRGKVASIGPAAGRRFFLVEDEFWVYIRRWVEQALIRAQRDVTAYTETFKRLTQGDKAAIEITDVPALPIRPKPKPE